MKVIIAGSRTITDPQVTFDAIKESGFRPTQVLCGVARGPDEHGHLWAFSREIDCCNYPADWKKHGRAAGPIRNQEMVDAADALIAVWDGRSRGTADVIRRAKAKGIPVYVKMVNVPKEAP